jgi:chromosome segregation ATPase
MPPIIGSSSKSGDFDALPLANTGSLEGFIKYLGILASSSESKFAATVVAEITQQREHIQSQEEELKRNQTTINGMFQFNQDEKAKQKDSATQIESLRATVNEKESKIAEYSKSLEFQKQEITELKSARSKEIAKVSQSTKDITTHQENLKDKDKVIDQMKTAGSN